MTRSVCFDNLEFIRLFVIASVCEAIQTYRNICSGLLRRFAPRNDGKHALIMTTYYDKFQFIVQHSNIKIYPAIFRLRSIAGYLFFSIAPPFLRVDFLSIVLRYLFERIVQIFQRNRFLRFRPAEIQQINPFGINITVIHQVRPDTDIC